ncbi:hypothetical protein POM88_041290 [Heracleum sosnowskyi]|uniref:Uncharacterized protein n=1 Tax=Heracleum sosnowskyi TaxID=360622 RepID=A0AAD8HG43_9APIA|nr:hypothetical protein POM88_041290 [Heracleum sosnowskyi]
MIFNISKLIAGLVLIFLTLQMFPVRSASLLQEKNSIRIFKCGGGGRKMGVYCIGGRSNAGMMTSDIWFQSLKKKQSPPPPPVIKKQKQLKSTSLSSKAPPRF